MNKKPRQKRAPTNHKKTLSRLMAVQIFYQHEFFNRERKLEEIKEELIENYLLDSQRQTTSYRKEIDESFLNVLVTGLSLEIATIDAEISEFLKGDWSLDQLEDVTLQILRVAAFELKNLSDIPAKVVIGEYVDIAASFFDSKRLTFVNATLDALAKKFRTAEFEK
ncbi:MAG: transcription antitermination factor NusB [Rickettsiales bacterium]|nr:transcription antitermination factor NusB [Rickettsiales bacterium]